MDHGTRDAQDLHDPGDHGIDGHHLLAGAFGYLSAAFQGAIKDTKQQQIMVAAAKEEKSRLEARKKEIDAQIGNLPANNVRGRQKLISAFKAEADRVNKRLEQLDAQLPEMQVEQITIDTHAGPIVFVSQAFNVSVERAVKYVILTIIFVFDPLAIALLVAGNFLWEARVQALRESSPAAIPSETVSEPQQESLVGLESLDEGVEALPGATPTTSAAAVSAPIPGEEAREDGAAIDVGQPPAQIAASDQLGEQTRVHLVEPAGAAEDDAGLADVTTVAVESTAPRIPIAEQAIREAAYYTAEKRQFKDGTPADDWVQAEEALKKDRSIAA